MYLLNIVDSLKKMTVHDIRDCIFGNYYKRIGFSKENSHYSIKHADIRYVITEHPKTSHKLSKTIRQAEKASQIGSNSSLYSDIKKRKFFEQKNCKK